MAHGDDRPDHEHDRRCRRRTRPASRSITACRSSARRRSRAARTSALHSAGRDHVVGNEAPERHARGAGDERRERADEPDEAADEDRRAAVAVEEALDLLQPGLGDLDPRAVADEELAAQPAAEHVARHVAGHRRGPHDRQQRDDVDLPLSGDDAAEQDRGLPRRDEADEGAGLEEGHHADEHVGVRAERLADVLDRLLEVRRLDDARAVDDQAGDQQDEDDARLVREPAEADRQESRDSRGEQEGPDGFTALANGYATTASAKRGRARARRRLRAAASLQVRNTPNVVGPEPLTIARLGPGRAQGAERRRRSPGTASGPRARGRCPGPRAGASRRGERILELARGGSQLARRARQPEPVGLGEHVGGREPLAQRQHDDARSARWSCEATDVLAGAGHER